MLPADNTLLLMAELEGAKTVRLAELTRLLLSGESLLSIRVGMSLSEIVTELVLRPESTPLSFVITVLVLAIAWREMGRGGEFEGEEEIAAERSMLDWTGVGGTGLTRSTTCHTRNRVSINKHGANFPWALAKPSHLCCRNGSQALGSGWTTLFIQEDTAAEAVGEKSAIFI